MALAQAAEGMNGELDGRGMPRPKTADRDGHTCRVGAPRRTGQRYSRRASRAVPMPPPIQARSLAALLGAAQGGRLNCVCVIGQ